jgi:hypothetical protein
VPSSVYTIGIVEFRGAVQTEANQKVVHLEESTPFVVQQYAVGLD